MSKDLVVFLPSRDNPHGCEDTLSMLYNTCQSQENFDIVCIVDEDQINMYSDVINRFPTVIWKHPEHKEKSFVSLNEVHFKFIEDTDYYFNWWIVDDFAGLTNYWDEAIVKKKDIYSDGYYTLYTNNPMSRNLNALSNIFRYSYHWIDGHDKPLVDHPPTLIYHYHEMLPICTKKWRLKIKRFFDDYGGGDHVFLNAALAHILSREYGYSRMIEADFYYKSIVDNQNAAKIQNNGLTRDEHFYKESVIEDFKNTKLVASEVAQDIWQHYRDVMDKPRKRGKYAPVH